MDQLPAHVLGGILDGLPPPSLVTCGCVCKEWRAAVEARHGLLLPRSLHGIFINYDYDGEHSRLFSRPADPTGAGDIVDGTMDFVPRDRSGRLWWNFRVIVDHCNGLLLYDDDDSGHYVCNPATRRWVLLPEPAKLQYGTAGYPEIPSAMYLAFDPAVSLNYEVVRLRGLAGSERREGEMSQEERRLADAVEARRVSTEWPPAVLEVDVFSSATGRWEERQFVREGGAVVTVAYIMSAKMWPKRMCDGPSRWYAEYWKGVLYVHVREVLLIRLSLSDNTCTAIKTPRPTVEGGKSNTVITDDDEEEDDLDSPYLDSYLGKSEKGIYFVTLHNFQIWVWSLNESSVLMEWVLQHHSDLFPLSSTPLSGNLQGDASWILEDYYSDKEVTNDTDSDDEGSDSEVSDNGDQDNLKQNSDNSNCGDEEDDTKEEDDTEHDNSQRDSDSSEDGDDEESEEYDEWNSDDDYTLETKNSMDDLSSSDLYFFGLHPYKEIVFLGAYCTVAAYHLGRRQAQYLGCCIPCGFNGRCRRSVTESFPYTPCFIDALRIRNSG